MKVIIMAFLVAVAGVSAADKKVLLKDLPIAVQHTVQSEEAKGAKVVGLAKEVEGGKTMYEVETIVAGRTRDLLLNASGHIVVTEEEMSSDMVPAAVKRALEARGKVGKIEMVTKGKVVTYEAVVEAKGKKIEVAVSAEGKPLKP